MKKCYYNVYSMNPSLFGTGQTGQERGRFLGKDDSFQTLWPST